ncbi:MAG: ImmA/IrrE family metallo-endopeptidase [Candidatus Limousia pullorum]|nr:ImmA/IrrE family metallo-endopeptidase [Mediterraneibacter gnavus]MDY3778705.1 ImmA/IrrE family metallo-endopeptidase [Candidatus Limousia pullorum]
MQVYVSNREIEQIAEGLVHVACGKPPPKRIDIDAVAAYLGLTVRYEKFAESDPDKIGFTSDGKSALTVFRNGKKQRIVFSKETIVLDSFLQYPCESSRRRFTLAHEISHILINRADPTHTAPCFNRVYDTERRYNLNELHERMNLGECQANTMAAIILMPKELLTASVRRHFRKSRIPVYGDCVFLPEIKPVMQAMADELGVSFTAMLIQLRKYDLLEERDMAEYFDKIKGGDRNG